jgi:hypothetical protein
MREINYRFLPFFPFFFFFPLRLPPLRAAAAVASACTPCYN